MSCHRPPFMATRNLFLVSLVLAFATGCMRQQKLDQLGEVAKGWCRTIRASQVIPVYPLTEDVEVGDIFVVQRPIEDEVQLYEQKGFLPLGTHLARLHPAEYARFYDSGSYLITRDNTPPHVWSHPWDTPTTTAPAQGTIPARLDRRMHTNWQFAPRAAFPSYSFRIQNSAALDAAIPIQSIPVGLALTGAEEAAVSVSLSDAMTYGLGVDQLLELAMRWAGDKNNRGLLMAYQPALEVADDGYRYRMRYSYLRVICRVYLVGKVNVSIQDTASGSAQAEVRLPNLRLTDTELTRADQIYSQRLAALNAGLAGAQRQAAIRKVGDSPSTAPATVPAVPATQGSAEGAMPATDGGSLAPGAAVRVTSFTSRSVSLDEEFARPLVVGYLAFDLPIGPGGTVRPTPVATIARLRHRDAGFLRMRLVEWTYQHPHARQVIREWVEQNQSWLRDEGLDEFVAADGDGTGKGSSLDSTQTGPSLDRAARKLEGYMRNPVDLRAVVPLNLVVGPKYYRLNTRLVADLVENPLVQRMTPGSSGGEAEARDSRAGFNPTTAPVDITQREPKRK